MTYLFEKKFGTLKKKMVTFDGQTLSIGKKATLQKDEIKLIVYKAPTAVQAGTVYFSRDYTGLQTNFSDVTKYTLYFNLKDKDEVDSLVHMIGAEVEIEEGKLSEDAKVSPDVITCPNCSSTDVTPMGNNRKSFSVGKAAAGGILTGGIGSLAGFAGKKGKTDRWHCRKCGTRFDQ